MPPTFIAAFSVFNQRPERATFPALGTKPQPDVRAGKAPITVGDNVWLSSGVILCPGVTIGDDTVVGAGAVVTRDLPAGVVAMGVPARAVREISEADRVELPQL